MHTLPTSTLFDLSFFAGQPQELLEYLNSHLNSESKLLTIATPNPEHVVQLQQDTQLRQAIQAVDIRIPDGIGIVWASRLLAKQSQASPIIQRVSGRELAQALLLSRQDKIHLVIGGQGYQTIDSASFESSPSQSDSPQLFKLTLRTDASQDAHVWWTPGYKQVAQPTPEEQRAIKKILTLLKPQVVYLAFGAPQQEIWLQQHYAELQQAGVQLAMVVGGAFDVILGKKSAPPIMVQYLHLEWLYRLIREPWRWRRQLRLVRFVRTVLIQKIKSINV